MMMDDAAMNVCPPAWDWFPTEYHPQSVTGRIPNLFLEEYGATLQPIVRFLDPSGNLVDISFERSRHSTSFTDGWKDLKTIYPIRSGAWLFLHFASPTLINIVILDRNLAEINYPTPPARFLNIHTALQDLFDNHTTGLPHHYPQFDPQMTKCIISQKKKISYAQARGRAMTLDPPFTQIFINKRGPLTMIDELGNQFPIRLHWNRPKTQKALIVEGWPEFCERRLLTLNTVVDFRAPWFDPSFIFVRVLRDPMLLVK